MSKPLPQAVPFGRLSELRAREDACLIAFKIPAGAFDDCRLKRYASRLALEAFLKRPGQWHALVKNKTHPNMLLYPAFQVADESAPIPTENRA